MSYPTPGEIVLVKRDESGREIHDRMQFDHVQPTEWGVRCFDLEEQENGVKQAETKLYYPWHRIFAAKRYTDTDGEENDA